MPKADAPSRAPRPAVMFLGPTKRLGTPGPQSVLGDFAEARREQTALAGRLEIPFVLMEEAPGRAGEAYTDKFFRVVDEGGVRTFIVLWPVHAQMNALDVEFGFFLARLRDGALEADAVQLLVERRVAALREEGGEAVLASDEAGNRTFYYGDFAQYGCPFRRWGTPLALFRQTADVLREHAERFPVSVSR